MSSASWIGFLYQSTGWCWFNHKSHFNSICCCCTQFTDQKGWKCVLWKWSSVTHNWFSNQMDYVEASKFCSKSLLSWISRQRLAHGILLCDLITRLLSRRWTWLRVLSITQTLVTTLCVGGLCNYLYLYKEDHLKYRSIYWEKWLGLLLQAWGLTLLS